MINGIYSSLTVVSKQGTPKGPKYFLHSKQGAFANCLIKAFTVVSGKLLVLWPRLPGFKTRSKSTWWYHFYWCDDIIMALWHFSDIMTLSVTSSWHHDSQWHHMTSWHCQWHHCDIMTLSVTSHDIMTLSVTSHDIMTLSVTSWQWHHDTVSDIMTVTSLVPGAERAPGTHWRASS